MSKYKLLTFDVTNTLLKIRSNIGHQYSKTASLYGVQPTVSPDHLTASFKTNWKRLNEEQPNFGRNTSNISSRDWWMELVRSTFAGVGHRLDSGRLGAITSHLTSIYATDACWDVMPGTLELLTSLKNSNLIVGIISNFDDQLFSVLKHTGLLQYFDLVINSYAVCCYKPQSAIFQVAHREACKLRPTDDIGLHEALHVGNDLQLDYFGARSAGWNALLIVSEKDTVSVPEVDPSFVVEHLLDVKDFIFHENKSLN